jgi:hypothetical protein
MTKKKFHGSRKRKEFKAQGERATSVSEPRGRGVRNEQTILSRLLLDHAHYCCHTHGTAQIRREFDASKWRILGAPRFSPYQHYEITPFQALSLVLARSRSLTALSAASPSFS